MKNHFHHLHKRKRIYKKLEKYPHPSRSFRILDKIVLVIAFLFPLIELPQLLEIYIKKSAQNVSIITWSFFVLFGIPWIIYGIVHKEKPIVILYALWIIIDSLIVLGIVLY